MNLTVKLKDLRYIVDLVSTVTPTRTTLPSLSAVLLAYDDCVLTACASDLRSFARAHCDAVGEQSGAFGVRADLLACFLGGCTADEVTIVVDQRVNVFAGTMKAIFSKLTPEEFQAHPEVEGNCLMLPAKELHSGLGKVLHAASDDETNKATLCSVAFDFSPSLNLVAFSGIQLGVVSTGSVGYGQHIAPRQFISSLMKVIDGSEGEVSVTFGENLMRVASDKWSLSGALIDGKFPPWQNINKWENMPKRTLNRSELIAAIKNCVPFGEAGFTRIRVEGEDGTATVEIAGENQSSSTLAFQGEPFMFFVDGKKMIGLLNALEGDTVTLEYKDERGVGIVVRENNFTAAIMPLEK